jgi:fucose 4-O-acetylase-like acetyltransferase
LMINKKMFLTKIGTNSLAIYILHFCFVGLLNEYFMTTEIGLFIKQDIFLSMVYSAIVVASIIFLLSRDKITKYLGLIIKSFEINTSLLLKRINII